MTPSALVFTSALLHPEACNIYNHHCMFRLCTAIICPNGWTKQSMAVISLVIWHPNQISPHLPPLNRHLSPHPLSSVVVFPVLAVMNSFRGRSLVFCREGSCPSFRQASLWLGEGLLSIQTASHSEPQPVWSVRHLPISHLTPGAVISQGLAHKVA